MKAREGDLIENTEGFVFDVKGLVHPSKRVIAFARYFPDQQGKRTKNGNAYRKVYSLSDRCRLIQKRFPEYVIRDPVFDEVFCEVPTNQIKKHYKPFNKLEQLRTNENLFNLETQTVNLAKLLKQTACIPWTAVGVSGSIMVGLQTPNSDIDLIVYGSSNCRKVHRVLAKLLHERQDTLRPYTVKELKALFDFRSKDNAGSFEDFVRTESRKVLQGKFHEIDYFIRFVKDWDEVNEQYGDIEYRNIGHAGIEAEVADSSESIFTPCTYKIKNVKIIEGAIVKGITEIVSFRGRFCDQAKVSESVVAHGKVEHVLDKRTHSQHFRLLLGNKPSDYMILR